jgi:hypothetical protein
VEVGEVIRVDLAVDTDNLVVEVLLEVRLNVLRGKRLELTSGFLALEAGGQG